LNQGVTGTWRSSWSVASFFVALKEDENTMMTQFRDFLELSYAELEELNLQAKAQRMARTPIDQLREERMKYLTDEKRIKAVTVLFSDLEAGCTCWTTTRSSCSSRRTT
jgi:hypothetical protein